MSSRDGERSSAGGSALPLLSPADLGLVVWKSSDQAGAFMVLTCGRPAVCSRLVKHPSRPNAPPGRADPLSQKSYLTPRFSAQLSAKPPCARRGVVFGYLAAKQKKLHFKRWEKRTGRWLALRCRWDVAAQCGAQGRVLASPECEQNGSVRTKHFTGLQAISDAIGTISS